MRHPQLPVRQRVSAETAAANRRMVDALYRTSSFGDLPTQLANALQTGGDETVHEVADLFQQLEARDPEISARLGEDLASQMTESDENDSAISRNPQIAAAPALPVLYGLLAGGAAIGAGEALRQQFERQRRNNVHNRPPSLVPPPALTPNRTPENKRPQAHETITKTPPQTQPPLGFTGVAGPIPESKTPQLLIGPSLDKIVKELPVYENRGNDETKDELDDVRDWYLDNNPGFQHTHGGRDRNTGKDKKEKQFPGPGIAFKDPVTGKKGDSRPGSRFADLTFYNPETGKTVHIQTVDVDKNGNIRAHDLEAAEAMRRTEEGADILLIKKKWQMEKVRQIQQRRKQRGIYP